MDIIVQAIEYYDKGRETYDTFLSKVHYVNIVLITDNDMEHNMLALYDKDKKELVKLKYEILGTLHNDSSTWIWGWADALNFNNQTYLSKKVLNYALTIGIGSDKTKFNENFMLKTELITSRFKISSPLQIDFHIGIGSYISKIPLVIPIVEYADDFSSSDTLKKFYNNNNEIYQLSGCKVNYLFIINPNDIKL